MQRSAGGNRGAAAHARFRAGVERLGPESSARRDDLAERRTRSDARRANDLGIGRALSDLQPNSILIEHNGVACIDAEWPETHSPRRIESNSSVSSPAARAAETASVVRLRALFTTTRIPSVETTAIGFPRR